MEKDKGCITIQVKGLMKIIDKFRAENILCTFVMPRISCTKLLFQGLKISAQRRLCSNNTLKKYKILKHSWRKIIQLLWTDVSYIFTKKMLNIDLNMLLTVLMEFTYIRHSWTSDSMVSGNLCRWWIWQSCL